MRGQGRDIWGCLGDPRPTQMSVRCHLGFIHSTHVCEALHVQGLSWACDKIPGESRQKSLPSRASILVGGGGGGVLQ